MKLLLRTAVLLLALCWLAAPTRAEETAAATSPATPTETESPEGEPAAASKADASIRVLGGTELDQLTVGSQAISERGPSILVEQLSEGLVSVRVQRGSLLWEGAVRVYAGQVTDFDAAVALTSAEAVTLGGDEFDLFAFYDLLDAMKRIDARLAYCSGVLQNPPPAPDDALVADACDRLARKKELQEQQAARAVEDPTAVLEEDLLSNSDEEAAERKLKELKRLYRADGRARKHPVGSPSRWVIAGLGFTGTGVGTGLAFYWEVRAEQQFILYRNAERLGDDLALTEQLHQTRNFDQLRNSSVGIAAVCLTTGIVATIIQRLEQQRFDRYKASLKAGGDDD
ncbi:MAG: hypothetical protein VX498_05360 [Myxococcota bacterium]|nr:hypothetical protein [Myxococcota bacterium]